MMKLNWSSHVDKVIKISQRNIKCYKESKNIFATKTH